MFEAPDRTKPSARTPEAFPTAQNTGPTADPRLPLPNALATAVASGLTLWTSFPALNWWPAAPIALAGFALATNGQRPRRAFGLGLAGGPVFFLLHVHWSGVYVGAASLDSARDLRGPLPRRYVLAGPLGLARAWRSCRRDRRAHRTLGRAGDHPRPGAFRWVPLGEDRVLSVQAPTLGYAALGGAPLTHRRRRPDRSLPRGRLRRDRIGYHQFTGSPVRSYAHPRAPA